MCLRVVGNIFGIYQLIKILISNSHSPSASTLNPQALTCLPSQAPQFLWSLAENLDTGDPELGILRHFSKVLWHFMALVLVQR